MLVQRKEKTMLVAFGGKGSELSNQVPNVFPEFFSKKALWHSKTIFSTNTCNVLHCDVMKLYPHCILHNMIHQLSCLLELVESECLQLNSLSCMQVQVLCILPLDHMKVNGSSQDGQCNAMTPYTGTGGSGLSCGCVEVARTHLAPLAEEQSSTRSSYVVHQATLHWQKSLLT